MLTAELPILWALVVFPKGCQIPCPVLEIQGPYTWEACYLEKRPEAVTKYLFEHNINIWAVCSRED